MVELGDNRDLLISEGIRRARTKWGERKGWELRMGSR